MRVFTQLQRPQIHVATMQTLQHRTVFVKKVSITVILILESNEKQWKQNNSNRMLNVKRLRKKEKVMGQLLDSREGELNCGPTGITY